MIRIGISGWRYDRWRGVFYPKGLRQASELDFASRAVQAIEINGSHYSLQSPGSYRQWYDSTPGHFIFAVKGPRYLTHMLRFRDDTAIAATANFFASGVLALGGKIGPFLWQFPPSYRFDAERFESFLRLLPRDTDAAVRLARQHDARVKQPLLEFGKNHRLRHAIEIRHDSFRDPAFVRLLRAYRVALVISDSTEKWPQVEDVTADFVYLRLHGTQTRYTGRYSDAALDRWAERIGSWAAGTQPDDARLIVQQAPRARRSRDVFCFFDNDAKVHAPFDARRLINRLRLGKGLTALEHSDPAEVNVGARESTATA
jgi:uncharacterized protein YecE (DUF72 family)